MLKRLIKVITIPLALISLLPTALVISPILYILKGDKYALGNIIGKYAEYMES